MSSHAEQIAAAKDALLSSEPRAKLMRIWLRDGINRNRKLARECRVAYQQPYMAAACDVMADLHDQCADLYAAKLAQLEEEAR